MMIKQVANLKPLCKGILFTFLCLQIIITESKAKSAFETYGDIVQALPIAMMIYSYSIDDMQGVKEQAIGAGVTLLSTHAIKQSFVLIASKDESIASISQRPNRGSFDGFPSGHTSVAFSSVGFAQKRYGWKWSVPLGLLASAGGISRIYAEKHTITQVIAGATLGFLASYLLASPYEKNSALSVWVGHSLDNTPTYNISYTARF